MSESKTADPCPHPVRYDRGECCGGKCLTEETTTTDKQRSERLRTVLAEALREKNVSEGSIPEFIHNIEEGISDD